MIDYQNLVTNHSATLIEKLLTHLLSQKTVDIRFDYLEQDQWSIISMHQYEEDLEISLRLHLNDVYDLFLGYYDDDDEFHEIIHLMNDEEKKSLPPVLKKAMKKVLDDEEGINLLCHFLNAPIKK